MMKNCGDVCKMSWIMEWYYVHIPLGFILVFKSISMKRSKWCLMDPNWWTEVSDACPLIYGCMPSVCTFSKVKVLLFFDWLSVVHMLWLCCVKHLLSFTVSLSICFRDVATGPNLSLTTDHMYLSCSLDIGMFIQWSRCRNCFWLCLLLLSTLSM